jgi:hypothetical protein
MEILNGIYRAEHADITEESHGGTTIIHEIYWYLCFYHESSIIGVYGTSAKHSIKWYFKKQFDQTGEIEYDHGKNLKFFICKPHTNERVIFEGEILEKKLHLKSYNESTPDKLWLEDDFEWLDLDYEKLEKEFGE